MITEQTIDKLKRMRLGHFAGQAQMISTEPAFDSLTFDERFGMLVDAEWEYRQAHKTTLLHKKAGFTDPTACVEAISYTPQRGLDRSQILTLATCGFITAHHDIVILGQTGVGKSFIAQALGNAACRNHHPTLYTRMTVMLDDLAVAHAAGNTRQALDVFTKPELLIIDDYMLTQPSKPGVSWLLELTERRTHTGSTIYCSQLAPQQWHERIEEAVLADAILDRIINRSHLVEIQGDSMRRLHKPTW